MHYHALSFNYNLQLIKIHYLNKFMPITVLRLGHRQDRDARISTHCGLVARAFGANEIIYAGEKDKKLIASIRSVSKQWGGKFRVRYLTKPNKFISKFRGLKIHLTMYGIPFEKKLRTIKSKHNILIIIGCAKVPREIYELADLNLAVTNQPHSEVASLAVFLNSLNRKSNFSKPKRKIIPCEKGKNVKTTK
jgi:tRNA (cytidine56-2'-O)-methyltransferase